MKFSWVTKEVLEDKVQELQTSDICETFAKVLTSRGIASKEKAYAFLNPKLKDMHDPFLFYGMEEAVKRVKEALEKKEKIFLYGDFDVDGITSTSLLYLFFQSLKMDVGYYIPDRLKDGYGLNIGGIEHIHENGGNLIITVDCGVSGLKEIDRANELGIDVIVTDHHELGEEIPNALSIINPKDSRGTYPFKGIAGVGVAYKLAWGICQKISPERDKVVPALRTFLLDAMALVALGTIADVAPLCDENRIMAKYGLRVLKDSKNPGIKALKSISKIEKLQSLEAHHVGFRLGPRINAMGRLENGSTCVELLTTDNHAKAMGFATELEKKTKKEKIQDRIYKEAKQQIVDRSLLEKEVIVLSSENWHAGVIGIVASRILEEYYKPVFLIALKNGEGRASARSVPGYHLFLALQACSQYLVSYGGHEMAAGFKVKEDQIKRLARALNKFARENSTQISTKPLLEIDAYVDLHAITRDLYRNLSQMAPFGEANPKPVLAVKNVEIIKNPSPMRCGKNDEHLIFRVKQGTAIFKAIAFGGGALYDDVINMKYCNIAFTLLENKWRDTYSLELEVKDIEGV